MSTFLEGLGLATLIILGLFAFFGVCALVATLTDLVRNHKTAKAERDYWKKEWTAENERVAELRERLEAVSPYRGEGI